jgi:hypothetical protein
MTEKRQSSQGYIIRILQHFATKLWNITNFVMLFQAVMKFLSRLVEIKILSITLFIFLLFIFVRCRKSWCIPYLSVCDIQLSFPAHTQTRSRNHSFQHTVLITAAKHAIISLTPTLPIRIIRERAEWEVRKFTLSTALVNLIWKQGVVVFVFNDWCVKTTERPCHLGKLG